MKIVAILDVFRHTCMHLLCWNNFGYKEYNSGIIGFTYYKTSLSTLMSRVNTTKTLLLLSFT